jgi:glycosyltransferase involved in cell wall biosynthesis
VKIVFLTTGPIENPGPRTRVFQYLPYFEADRIPFEVVEAGLRLPMQVANLRSRWDRERRFPATVLRSAQVAEVGVKVLSEGVRRVRTMEAGARALLFDADVIFSQAVLPTVPMLRLLQASGKRIAFDMCDALYTRNGRFQEGERLARILPYLDLVIVASDETEAWMRERSPARTMVVTGPIDTRQFHPGREGRDDEVVIGWIGSATTTHYLARVAPALARLAERYPQLKLKTVGAGRVSLPDHVRVEQVDWSLEGEARALRTFDVGLMPLDDDPWSRGKGGYKLLQYMATGIPCVASPVGVNRSIVVHGESGFLADDQEQWVASLARLIEDAALRRAMGVAGRRLAVERYSFDHYYPEVRDALFALSPRAADRAAGRAG